MPAKASSTLALVRGPSEPALLELAAHRERASAAAATSSRAALRPQA